MTINFESGASNDALTKICGAYPATSVNGFTTLWVRRRGNPSRKRRFSPAECLQLCQGYTLAAEQQQEILDLVPSDPCQGLPREFRSALIKQLLNQAMHFYWRHQWLIGKLP
ncbi:MAG: hypothetical protein ACRC62_20705 [Microcoleus sp.]